MTSSFKKRINSQKKAVERDREKIHGRLGYRVRKQLEEEGQKEVREFKKNVS